jgi:hypothetical protein
MAKLLLTKLLFHAKAHQGGTLFNICGVHTSVKNVQNNIISKKII